LITNLDRLAHETPEVTTCVKSKLADYEYQRFRYFIPTTQQDFDEIENLHDRVLDCWRLEISASETAQIKTTLIEKEKCLINSIGENAYRQIYEGKRSPTQNEHLWFEKCFGNIPASTVVFLDKDENLSKETISCLKKTLGPDLYQKVYSQKAQVPANLQKGVEICFGAKSQPFEIGSVYKIPESVRNCLTQNLGEVKIDMLIEGVAQLTEDKKEKAVSCFEMINQSQKKFLPPPPEQIPFIKESDSIKVTNVKQEKKTIKKKTYGGKITLEGRATPNSIVNLYFFSEPIVVTTKTDENGDWIFEMQKPMDEGKHIVYAMTKTEEGNLIRSSILSFEVIAAEKVSTPQIFLEEDKVTSVTKDFIYYSLAAILIISLIISGSIFYIQTSKKINKMGENELNRNSKTKP